MNEKRKQVVLLSASPKPKPEEAASDFLCRFAQERLQDDAIETQLFRVRPLVLRDETQAAFDAMCAADAVLMIFPLYFFCMPAVLTRFLQDYAAYSKDRSRTNAVLYAFVNCGFPEPDINLEAVLAAESFSKNVGMAFRSGVLIGGGGMLLGTKDAPFMKPLFESLNQTFETIKRDVLFGDAEPERIVSLPMKFPRAFYFLGGNLGWKYGARKNGLKRKELYRTPYLRD